MIMHSGTSFSDEPNRNALFIPGQLVRHQRYGYRGVIVAFDHACQAEEAWYSSNQTRPDRKQPWYHVLVDGSTECTYAAQTSLAEDDTQEPIRHPYVDLFFADFRDGLYLRNDKAWEGAW